MKPCHGRIAVKTKSMPYMRFGTGEKPFVILPGISMFPVTQNAEAVVAQFAMFTEAYTVYLFDRAEPVTEGISVEEMTDETATAMELLGLNGADIYGASQGGMMALSLAERFPQLVHKIVLASVAAYCTDEARETLCRWSELGRAGNAPALNRNAFCKIYSEEYRNKYASAFRYAETLGTAEDCLRFARLAEACIHFDCRPLLTKIHCPALIAVGRKDTVFSEGADMLADTLHGTLLSYPDGSHAVYDEDTDFVKQMFAFLCR